MNEIEFVCDQEERLDLPKHPSAIPELLLSKTFYPIGFPLEVRTNSEAILEMNDRMWRHFRHEHNTLAMRSDVYVTDNAILGCPPAPVYQYAEPLFVGIADAQHYTVVDLARGKSFTSITAASLKYRLYIEQFFLMTPLGTIPAKALHAACVAWNGRGVLLCGESGAGKSTLAYACARAGWEYISDDGSFLLEGRERCVAGNCNLVRFRPSAAELFPELRNLEETPRAGGKPSIELPTAGLPYLRCRSTVPINKIVFLNRAAGSRTELLPFPEDTARFYMRQGIYATAEARAKHFAAIARLLTAGTYELRYSNVEDAVERLCRLVDGDL